MQPHSCGYQRTTALWDLQGIWSILDAKLAASGLSGFMGLYKGGRGLATLWTEEYRQKFHTKSLWPEEFPKVWWVEDSEEADNCDYLFIGSCMRGSLPDTFPTCRLVSPANSPAL